MIEDKLLIWKLKSGDGAALTRVHEKYKNDLLRIASGLSNRTSAAEDIVHDVFVSLAQSPQKLKLSGNLKGYLATCVANRVRNSNRAGQRRDTASLDEAEPVTQDSHGPDRWIIQNEELQRLNNAMAQLPYPQREAVILHVQAGMRFKAIAKSQNVSINTAQSRYRYGLDKLRSLLNSEVGQ
ncbi:MAG TPA: sigma-70 family RNA polymerase sigma factor [Sedimentisphaerales bacterium]|nr:sigma-70 family RNA polymerase sigma factor [Sedimentisphaerales bacterium]